MGLSSILKELLVATAQTRRPLSFFSPSSLPPWPMLRQTQPFSTPTLTVATHMLSAPMVLMVPMVLTVLMVPTPTTHTPIPAATMLPAQQFHALTTMSSRSSRGKPRPRLTLPSSTLTLTVATTADLVPTPTPMATAPTPTLPTLTPVAATMPALLSHAPTVLLPP